MPKHLCLVLFVCASFAARAASANEKSAADALLEQAEAAFVQDSDCSRALPLFEGANRLEPSWIALSGMAACREQAGQLDVAYRLYVRLLRDFGGVLPVRRRQRVEARLAALDPQLGTLTLHVDPADATVSVDGEAFAADEPIRLAPGAHTVSVAAPGHASEQRTVALAAGATTVETLTLKELDAAKPVVQPAPVTPALVALPPPRRPPAARSPWLWRGLAISGAALTATGATLLVLAERDFDRFDAQVASTPGSPELPVAGDRDLLDAGHGRRNLGLVLVGAGVTTVAGALLLRFWPTHATPMLDVRAQGVSVGAAWCY